MSSLAFLLSLPATVNVKMLSSIYYKCISVYGNVLFIVQMYTYDLVLLFDLACVQPDFLMGKGEKSVCESGNNTVFALSFELHGFMYSNVIGYCSEA
jgi:hypothetical protein